MNEDYNEGFADGYREARWDAIGDVHQMITELIKEEGTPEQLEMVDKILLNLKGMK